MKQTGKAAHDEAGIASALWAIQHSFADLVELLKYQQVYREARDQQWLQHMKAAMQGLAGAVIPEENGHNKT